MNFFQRVIFELLVISAFLGSGSLYSQEYIEDRVNIQLTDRGMVALMEGSGPFPFRLRAREEVRWYDARGHVGALLTEKRLLAISTRALSWHEFSLNAREYVEEKASLSPYLAMLVTNQRVIVFDGSSSRFVSHRLSPTEALLAVKTDQQIAVVVTSRQALGWTLGSKDFAAIRLNTQEEVISLETTARMATVRTTAHLLTLQGVDSSWQRFRLD